MNMSTLSRAEADHLRAKLREEWVRLTRLLLEIDLAHPDAAMRHAVDHEMRVRDVLSMAAATMEAEEAPPVAGRIGPLRIAG
jgi:hypothetical protein